jgi:Protein of unknown function (DUF3987)
LLVNDVTIEKLQECLANTGRGIHSLQDEIAGFLGFGRYNGKGDQERAFYLQTFEGGPYTVLRIGRPPVVIDNNAMSLYGAIQLTRIEDFPDLDKDGFIQRVSMVRSTTSELSQSGAAVNGYEELQEKIAELATPQACKCFTGVSDGGVALIRQTEADGQRLALLAEFGEGFIGWAKKMHGANARYALLLHLLDGGDGRCIPAATVERARILVYEYLLPNARDFFSIIPGTPLQRTRDVAGWILTHPCDRIVSSDIKASVRSCRSLSTKELNDALDPLVTGAWLRPETDFPSNRAWSVSPGLRQHFADRTDQERERRAEVRELIQNIGRRRRAAA